MVVLHVTALAEAAASTVAEGDQSKCYVDFSNGATSNLSLQISFRILYTETSLLLCGHSSNGTWLIMYIFIYSISIRYGGEI